MSLAKVIEVLSEGDSIEAAVQAAVDEAGETVRDIKHVYVNEVQGLVEGGRVARYRVNCKVTFLVDSQREG